METILNSKHRSLIMFIITGLLVFCDYFFIKHFIDEFLSLPKKADLFTSEHLFIIPLAISAYIWIGVTICSAMIIFKDLKSYKEKGLIRELMIGLIFGLLWGLVLGLWGLIWEFTEFAGFIGFIELIWGLLWWLVLGLWGLVNEFKSLKS